MLTIPKCKVCHTDINIIFGRGRAKILNSPSELIYCSNKCKLNSPEYKIKMSDLGKSNAHYMTDRIISKEEKEKKSISTKNSWLDKDIRNSRINNMKLYKNTSIHNEHISNALKGIKRSTEYKNKMSKIISEKYINGEFMSTKIKFNSVKAGKLLHLMSSYEFKFALYLDINPNVTLVQYQPFYLKSNNKRYIPDFYYEENNKKYLVEIDRYKGYKEKYGYGWKLQLAKEWCNNNNATFLYIDLTDICAMWKENIPTLNIYDINLDIQPYNTYAIEQMTQMLIHSKLYISIPKNDVSKHIDEDFIKLNYVSNRKFNTTPYTTLGYYDNYWDCKWKIARFSPNNAINYKTTLKTILNNIAKKNIQINGTTLISQIKSERYSISVFPEQWAEWIYKKLLTKTNHLSILDICGGFGGRILGFNKFLNGYKNYDYTYVDANKYNCINTQHMCNHLGIKNVTYINNMFENVLELYNKKYNLMFTSIPYYDLEKYNDIDIEKIYVSKELFISKFINNIFKLDCNVICINISQKYSHILNNDFVNYNSYKHINTFSIEMSKHPFQTQQNTELFYVYTK